MPIDEAMLVGLVPATVAAYLCTYGPGQALWGGRNSGIPRAFARVALSLLVTSITVLLLVAFDSFSLPRVVAINGAITLLGYLGLVRSREPATAAPPRGRLGVLVFAVALTAYWPPFEAHFSASDASAYLAAGVQLARYHTLEKPDELGPLVPPVERGFLFFSALGLPWEPPYSRMHGGLVVDVPGAPVAYPSFFPLPSAWSGLFSDALGARYGGGYAGLFAAAAVWAAYLMARARLGGVMALTVTALTLANAAAYWAGRMALAEPIAWFFVASGLVALDSYEERGTAADARLAGALLGATAIARIEYAGFVLAALFLRRALSLRVRALTPGFVVAFATMIGLTALEVALVHGAYTAPLVDTLWGIDWVLGSRWRSAAWTIVAGGALVVATYAVAVMRIGIVRATAAAAVATFALTYYRFSPDRLPLRTGGWLVAYIGWPALALAALGVALSWRSRALRPADGFVLLLLGIIGGCLTFDPHVMPVLPWASRRFVPMVIPGLLLLAGLACTELGRRSLVLGLVAYVALVVGVLRPARGVWRHDYYAGTYDQLQELVATLPKDGSFMIDNRLVPMLLGPPLWLSYGRNSLPAVTNTETGRYIVADLAGILTQAGKGPVYLLKPTLTAAPEPIPWVVETRYTDFTLQIALPEQTDGAPPLRLERYTQSVSLLRLEPVLIPPPAK